MELQEHKKKQACKDGSCTVCGLVPLAHHLRRSTRIVAESPAMQRLLMRVSRFARSEAPVAIVGETGTGKEVVARTLHANGARSKQPFVAINVAALPSELLESELFGHARGAFTGASRERRGLFEEAHGGTLFLDEIGEMPPALQVKLLRALQEGEVRRVGDSRAFAVDVRVVCATHRDLEQRVHQGLFRQDLYFRLKVLTLEVPPLRDRRKDILPLAMRFLADERRGPKGFSKEAEQRLLAHPWPGNVRELENAVKHGAALATDAHVCAEDLPEDLGRRGNGGPAASGDVLRALADVEREHVLRVLDACGGEQARAARVLGVGRNTLWRKLRSYAR